VPSERACVRARRRAVGVVSKIARRPTDRTCEATTRPEGRGGRAGGWKRNRRRALGMARYTDRSFGMHTTFSGASCSAVYTECEHSDGPAPQCPKPRGRTRAHTSICTNARTHTHKHTRARARPGRTEAARPEGSVVACQDLDAHPTPSEVGYKEPVRFRHTTNVTPPVI
jgi:hypothetical protein